MSLIYKYISRAVVVPCGLLVALPSVLTAKEDSRPNIIHILIDDIAYDDLSCYGSTDIKTPNIDLLASKGVKLTDFYAPHGTSTPSRAALLTGRYSPRINGGKGLSVLFPHSNEGLEKEQEICMAEILRSQGYRTGLFGKWHLGHKEQYLPTNHGFDEFIGIPYPNDHGPERLGGMGIRPSTGIVDPPIPLFKQTEVIKECSNIELPELPATFRQEACRFIYRSVKQGTPFYLHYANIETHTPYFIPRGFEGRSSAGAYGDAVEFLDNTVGIIMNMLKVLKIENNTIIIISVDNGPLIHKDTELENCYGRFGETDPTRKHILRAGKYQEKYDGGIRVPCIVLWDGVIPAGSTCSNLTTAMDIFTTLINISGGEIPSDRPIDGKNILPLLKGEKDAVSPHEAVFGFRPRGGIESVRYKNWKLILSSRPTGTRELFDMDNDIGETTNVAHKYPEIVRKMVKLGENANNAIKNNRPID